MKGLVLVVAMLASSAAFACSCNSTPAVLPTDGSSDVPTNVVLRAWYPYSSSAPPTSVALVKKATGEAVELASSVGPSAFLRSFTPRALLEPMTQYEFTLDDVPVNFTTGAGEDHEPPATPTLANITYAEAGTPDSASCGIRKVWSLHFSGGDDARTPREELLVFAQTANSDEPADAVGVTNVSRSTLGVTMCSTNFEPPKGSFPVAIQVMDLAGNLSALSTSKPASSCASVPALFAALALLTLSRKRR